MGVYLKEKNFATEGTENTEKVKSNPCCRFFSVNSMPSVAKVLQLLNIALPHNGYTHDHPLTPALSPVSVEREKTPSPAWAGEAGVRVGL
jgi:hypothetical protein